MCVCVKYAYKHVGEIYIYIHIYIYIYILVLYVKELVGGRVCVRVGEIVYSPAFGRCGHGCKSHDASVFMMCNTHTHTRT